MTSAISTSYAAGLFDGEGWFEINRAKRSDCLRGEAFQVRAAMTMKSVRPLRALRRAFGGTLRQQTSRSSKHAVYFRWLVSGEQALAFAQAVLPHLMVKHRQAKLVVEFQTFKRKNHNQPNTDARHRKLTSMYTRMKLFNTKGREQLRASSGS